MKERNPNPNVSALEMAERERHVRLVLDNIDLPICYYGSDFIFRFVNRQYAEFIGRPEAEILGRNISEVVGDAVFEQQRQHLDRALAGAQVTYETDRTWPGRGRRRLRIKLFPDIGPTGAVRGIYAVGYDIDDDHRLRSELKVREERLARFADNIPEPIIYFDRDLRYRYVNRAFLEYRNVSREDVVGRTVAEVRGTEFAGDLQPLVERAYNGESVVFERQRPLENGTLRWNRVRLVPDFGPDGTVDGVYAVITDIDELKQTQAAVQRANWVLTSHIENTPMAVMEWDRTMRLTRWSQRAEAIFGWTAGEVIGHSMREWKFVFEDDVTKVEAIVQSMLTGERSSTTITNRNHPKDGSVIWCEWHHSVLRDKNEEILSILSFAQDVSDRVDAQERLETMATHDALTGLPNRVLLHLKLAETVDRARHRRRQVAILFIDLDRFKNVNDSLGHRMGDELLRLIGRRVGLALRKGDFLARLGGDEFTVLLEDVNDAASAAQVAAKLLEVIQQPYWVHGHAVHISAS
ncbi:MAG: PAS domain S-box protein, partial [Acidobacteriota bacterium]